MSFPDRTIGPMKNAGFVLLSLFAAACHTESAPVVPLRAKASPPPETTLVWVGRGEAERFDRGRWVRAEAFDYEFTVEQRRYPDHWESVKHMTRRHPAYDGSAGPRDQTLYFELHLGPSSPAGKLPVRIESTLGPGEGSSDKTFERASLVMHPDISSFAPFDTYRIEQSYLYREGKLTETVALDKGDRPWVRNRETATLFAEHRFDGPPTVR